jgi:regulator of protease activity HflC (stomatin/prohibitin superfamily)
MNDLPNGPLAQSVGIGFRVLQAATLLLAIGWACSNVREVPADSRVVVLRLGHVDRVQEAGLVLAWPRPIETIMLLPARDREIALKLETGNDGLPSSETDFQIHQPDDVVQLRPQKDTWNAGYFLTGDASVVQFTATLFYSISDPAAYFVEGDHVAPALQRIYRASALALAGSSELDDFLVARPESQSAAVFDASTRRERVASDLAAMMNRRLLALAHGGSDLGVEVRRIDIVAMLPPVAKSAFDAVLTATQTADQQAAASRTEAATMRAQADRDRARVVAEAEAAAQETISRASASAAGIRALAQNADPAHRDSVLTEYYQEQIGPILARAGALTAVDPRDSQRAILPGPDASPAASPGAAEGQPTEGQP